MSEAGRDSSAADDEMFWPLIDKQLAHTDTRHRADTIYTILCNEPMMSDELYTRIPGIIERCDASSERECSVLMELLQNCHSTLPKQAILPVTDFCLKMLWDDSQCEVRRSSAVKMLQSLCQKIEQDQFQHILSSLLSVTATHLEGDTGDMFRVARDFFKSFWRNEEQRVVYTPLILDVARQFVQDVDWKRRTAGLEAVAVVADGCNSENVSALVGLSIESISHQSADVRYASFTVLESLLRLPQSLLMTGETDRVLSAIVSYMAEDTDYEYPAAEVLGLVFNNEDYKGFLSHINHDDVLRTVIDILNKPLAEIYGDENEEFIGYLMNFVLISYEGRKIPQIYKNLVELLKPSLKINHWKPTYYRYQTIRVNRWAQALKCIALIGLIATVPDLADIRRAILAFLESLTGELFEWRDYYGQLIVAMEQVWYALSDEPFLDIVLLRLREALLRTDSNEESDIDADSNEECDLVDSPVFVAQKLLVMLGTPGLRASLTPHAHEWSTLMVQLCERAVSGDTTGAAISTFPHLLTSIKDLGVDAVMRMWRAQWKAVEKALDDGGSVAEEAHRLLSEAMDEATMTIGG